MLLILVFFFPPLSSPLSKPVQLVVAMEARAIMMAKGCTMRKWEFPYKSQEIRSLKDRACTCFFFSLSYLTVSKLRNNHNCRKHKTELEKQNPRFLAELKREAPGNQKGSRKVTDRKK